MNIIIGSIDVGRRGSIASGFDGGDVLVWVIGSIKGTVIAIAGVIIDKFIIAAPAGFGSRIRIGELRITINGTEAKEVITIDGEITSASSTFENAL